MRNSNISVILLWAMSACLLTSCKSVPVAASCPPFPPLPKVVQEQRGIAELPASQGTPFVSESKQLFQDLVNDIADSFDAAQVPSTTSKPVPPGR